MTRMTRFVLFAALLLCGPSAWAQAPTGVPVFMSSPSSGGAGVTWPLPVPTSTCTAPSLASAGDADTGIAFGTTPDIRHCVNGSTVATWAVPTGASTTSNFFNITGTLPAVTTATTSAVNWQITSAGSSGQVQEILRANLNAGYTGSSATRVFTLVNAAAGTGAGALGGGAANQALNLSVSGTTAGHNQVVRVSASGSSTLNVGVWSGITSISNSPLLNIGTYSVALNATTNVAGFFGLQSSAATFASSAALIADNGATTSDIFVARDNGTAVVTVADGGATTFATSIKTPTMSLPNTGAAATVGNATLVGGTVTVSTTAVLTGDVVMLTRKTSGGTPGTAITYTINNGVSFTITTDNALDTSTFSWFIVKTH